MLNQNDERTHHNGSGEIAVSMFLAYLMEGWQDTRVVADRVPGVAWPCLALPTCTDLRDRMLDV